jgi:hypothetical protein
MSLAVAMVVALAVPPGTSAEPLASLGSFGTPNGADGGQLVFPRGVAVNRSGNGAPVGSVYVSEGNANHRISQFTADGEFVRTWGFDVIEPGEENDNGTGFEICDVANGNEPADCKAGATGGAAGQLANPLGIAIDQASGHLYVPSTGNRRVDVFSGSGEFAGAFGWGVDTGAGAPEVCTTASTCQAAAAAGGDAGRFGALAVSNPAVDPNSPGRVYVPDPGNLRVAQYSTTIAGGVLTAAAFDRAFGWDVVPGGIPALESCTIATTCQTSQPATGGNNPGQFTSGGSPGAVAVDSTGAIYVTSGPLTNGTCSTATPCRIQKFSADAASVSDFGPSSGSGQLMFTSGTAPTVAPFHVAVDPVDDDVFVQRRVSSAGYQVLEYDSAGNHKETHPGGDALPSGGATGTNAAAGLAVGLSGRVYANLGSGTSGRVFILGPVEPAVVTIDPVSDVGTMSATFNGTVEIPAPGAPTFTTTYRFEYSKNGVDWTSVPASDSEVGDGSVGIHAVTEKVAVLDPNTLYAVRLVATTGPSATSATMTFTTGASAPRVEMAYVDEVTQTAAQLGAHVDPEGLDTTYHFEWGDQPCSEIPNPCAEVPAFERQLGDGNSVLIAKEQITGLEAASTYHYRVVARNSAATTHGPDYNFETLNHCNLTDGRCHELVSPPDKGPVGAAGDIATLGAEIQWQAAPAGNALQYVIAYGAADATAGEEVPYIARRDESGWSSSQLAPSTVTPSNEVSETAKIFRNLGMSTDLSCGFFASTQVLSKDAPRAVLDQGGALLYRRGIDNGWTPVTDTDPSNGQYQDLPKAEYRIVGMSDGPQDSCARAVFVAPYHYPEAPGAGSMRLYLWKDGALSYLGVVPGPDGPGCSGGACAVEAVPGAPENPNTTEIATGGAHRYDYWNAVSRDVSRVAFTAISKQGGDVGRQAVFVREIDSQVAIDVSQSQTATPNDDAAVYQTSSDDGSKVLFLGRTGLAANDPGLGPSSCASPENGAYANAGAGCDLYVYSVGADDAAGTLDDTLTDLSVPGVGTVNTAGAGVAGLLGASDDGEHVYFAARAQLVAGEGRTQAENLAQQTWSIYHSYAGQLDYVGRISSQQGTGTDLRGFFTADVGQTPTRVTPDGRHLLFVSSASPGLADAGGQPQAYLYDAEAERLDCVSCRRDRQPALKHREESFDPLTSNSFNTRRPPLTLTDDGSRVFFVSRNRLAFGATEGERNLYQWEEGQVSFVSRSAPNATTQGLRFVGASADGHDLYFATVDRLSWQDIDGKMDIYDARVGGGFPEPEPIPVPCDPASDRGCPGPGSAPVVVPATPTSSSRSDELDLGSRRVFSVQSLSRFQRARLAAGRRVRLRVRVNAPGTIRVRGTARIAGFRVPVFSGSARAQGPGRNAIPLSLSKAGRRRLSSTGVLKVTLVVRFADASREVVRRVSLRRPVSRTMQIDRRAGR